MSSAQHSTGFRGRGRGGRLRRIAVRLAVSGAVFLLCLLLAEGVLRLRGYGNFQGNAYSESDPELGWALRPNVSVDVVRPDHRYRVSTNSLGLRGGELRAPSSRRILLIGDSYAFGEGVDDDQTIASHLQSMLDERYGSSFEVVNGGVYGYGALQALGSMRRLWDSVRPAVVIYIHCGNDFADDLRHARGSYNKVRSAIPGREFLRSHSALYNVVKPGVLALLSKLGVYNAHIDFESKGEGGLVSDLGELRQQGEALTMGAVTEAAELCKERGAEFAVTTVGFSLDGERFSLSSDAQSVKDACRTIPKPIRFLDPTSGFPTTVTEPWYGQHSVGHFSPAGCGFFARSLFDGLSDAGWLPPTPTATAPRGKPAGAKSSGD